ncbi:hypothetical protein Y033_4781 [Burkholderia pseudomallei MSHR435]|nr:hypothetical protein Y034_5430 [Burkholderia pseudomallei MSHR449]KGX75059.1 hypothetical protein Y033_4781 [Burkholderia pseudomallei MSHR435]
MNQCRIAVAITVAAALTACGDNDGGLEAALRERDSRAISLCREYARSRASHPSTVDFSTWGARVVEQPDGSVIARSTFTARNGFGAEVKFEVACQVNGSGVVDGAVREAS